MFDVFAGITMRQIYFSLSEPWRFQAVVLFEKMRVTGVRGDDLKGFRWRRFYTSKHRCVTRENWKRMKSGETMDFTPIYAHYISGPF